MTELGDVRPVAVLSPRHVDDLMQMYRGEWWSSSRTVDDVRTMLANTTTVIGLEDAGSGRLLAFARVVSDLVYCGTLLDVIVCTDVRGRGHGGLLMRSIIDHPDLQRLRTLNLKCRDDKVAFYARWGFAVTTKLPPAGGQGPGAEMSRPMRGPCQSGVSVVPDCTA